MLLAWSVGYIFTAATKELWLFGISIDFGDETRRGKRSWEWLDGFVVLRGFK
jgi:hypothetical protein